MTSRPQLSRRPAIIFAAGLIMLSLAIVLLLVTLYLQHRPAKVTAAQTPVAIGQLISSGSVAMKIHGVTYSDGMPGFPVPADQHYIIVDLSIANRSDKPINILPTSDMYLKRPSGEVSYVTPFALKAPFHAGELSPGETVRGEISYVAPKSAEFKLYADGIWSGGVVPFSLQ